MAKPRTEPRSPGSGPFVFSPPAASVTSEEAAASGLERCHFDPGPATNRPCHPGKPLNLGASPIPSLQRGVRAGEPGFPSPGLLPVPPDRTSLGDSAWLPTRPVPSPLLCLGSAWTGYWLIFLVRQTLHPPDLCLAVNTFLLHKMCFFSPFPVLTTLQRFFSNTQIAHMWLQSLRMPGWPS